MKYSLLLILLLSSTNALPALYKWVDSNNQTHYSEEPPVNKKARLLPSRGVESEMAAASAPAAKTIMERAAELNKVKEAKKATAEEVAKKQAYTDALKSNCDGARKNLAALKDGIRLVEMDANGERSFLSDAQREQRMVKAQQDIQENCK